MSMKISRETVYHAECDVCPNDPMYPEKKEQWRALRTTRRAAEAAGREHEKSDSHATWLARDRIGGGLRHT